MPAKRKGTRKKKAIVATKKPRVAREKGPTKRELHAEAVKKAVQTKPFGTVLAFGSGDMAQLGCTMSDKFMERKNPTVVKTLLGKEVVVVSSGALHNAAVCRDGTLYTWGCEDDGALGRPGTEEEQFIPMQVKGALENAFVVKVACGTSHSMALTADGRVFTWGVYRDVCGKIGYSAEKGKKNEVLEPQQVDLKDIVVDIACSEEIDLLVTDKHHVYTFGDIATGQRKSDRHKLARLAPHRINIRLHGSRATPKVTKVFAGGYTSCVVTEDGVALIWGPNNYYQCALPNPVEDYYWINTPTILPVPEGEKVKQVCPQSQHLMVLCESGKVFSSGRGADGRLGHGDEVECKELKEIASLADKNIVGIAAGEAHSLAFTGEGSLYCWGSGDLCQLGTNSEDSEVNPKQVMGQQLTRWKRSVIGVAGGSQHSVCLASGGERPHDLPPSRPKGVLTPKQPTKPVKPLTDV